MELGYRGGRSRFDKLGANEPSLDAGEFFGCFKPVGDPGNLFDLLDGFVCEPEVLGRGRPSSPGGPNPRSKFPLGVNDP